MKTFSADGKKIIGKYIVGGKHKDFYNERSDYASLEGHVLLGLKANILPHNAKHKEVFKEQLETISKNDQFFFLNYMFFTYTTYILARDVVHSVNLSLYLILNQFICTLKEFGKAFKVFSIDLDQSQLKSIVDLRDQLDEIIINKFDNINETISKYESHLADFQKKITNDTKISAKSIHEHLQNANLILQKSLDSTVQLENSGSEVGEVIFTNLEIGRAHV